VGEEFGQQLRKNAVAYLDLDSSGAGSYFLRGGRPVAGRAAL